MVESAWMTLVTTVRQRLLEVPSVFVGNEAVRVRKEIFKALEELTTAELPENFYRVETEKSDTHENDDE